MKQIETKGSEEQANSYVKDFIPPNLFSFKGVWRLEVEVNPKAK